jgi:putative PIN family toxin of toxin-antitoxin system
MRCILDTDVLIAVLHSQTGASRRIIEMVGHKEITAIASVNMMIEYEAVLTRPEHLAAANLTPEDADILLNTFASLFALVTLHFLWRPMLKDPDDEMILEAAVNGQADVIITFNTRHFTHAATRFNIATMKPSEFLRRYTP